ncbi:MAG: hypothetical protein QXG03_03715 [Halalkalicoccus sp.]
MATKSQIAAATLYGCGTLTLDQAAKAAGVSRERMQAAARSLGF